MYKRQILDTDLFLYNRMTGSLLGADGEFLASPHLDDLQCAFSSLKGFLAAEPKDSVAVHCVYAVSYTHLDVYKRQALECQRHAHHHDRRLAGQPGSGAGCAVPGGLGLYPVPDWPGTENSGGTDSYEHAAESLDRIFMRGLRGPYHAVHADCLDSGKLPGNPGCAGTVFPAISAGTPAGSEKSDGGFDKG